MEFHRTRREFLAGAGAATALVAVSGSAANPHRIRYGYTAMPWDKQEREAIDDISAVGYQGIQFRADALTDFTPDQLRATLSAHKLIFVALSSGAVSLDQSTSDQVALHGAHADFVRKAGGLYLQVLDELKGYPRNAAPEECRRLGQLLTEIGKRTADAGIPLGYHNHLNTLSQMPENLARILDNADPRYVKLELDTAHSVAGGGDPAKQIIEYRDRMLFLHLKDVVDLAPGSKGKYPFQFVELGNGRVDFPAVFEALRTIGYRGWAVVELDREPIKTRSPKESAIISREYLEQLHQRV